MIQMILTTQARLRRSINNNVIADLSVRDNFTDSENSKPDISFTKYLKLSFYAQFESKTEIKRQIFSSFANHFEFESQIQSTGKEKQRLIRICRDAREALRRHGQ